MWVTKAVRSTSAFCLALSVSIALFKSGYLTNTILSYQTCALLISFGLIPLVQDYHQHFPNPLKYILATIYTVLILIPLSISLIINLFTGHRTSDAKWYSGIWRVYAILALWMLIAWTIENKIKPALKHYDVPFLFGANSSTRSIPLAVQNLRREQRDRAVANVYALIKEKAMEKVKAKRRVELKKSHIDDIRNELSEVRDNMKEKKEMLAAGGGDVVSVELAALGSKAENMEERIESIEEQITYISMRIKMMDEALEELRTKWEDARDINNYAQFYR